MAYGRGRAVVSTPIGIGPVRRRPRSAPNGFASKLRVAETKLIGPFLSGAALGKRSQKGRITWASYKRLLTVFPLPEPVIHQAWHR